MLLKLLPLGINKRQKGEGDHMKRATLPLQPVDSELLHFIAKNAAAVVAAASRSVNVILMRKKRDRQ
jgi:hypothetical protein